MSAALIRRRKKLRADINALGPILQGSVTSVAVRCGNPNCKCAEGQRHRSICLSTSHKGKTRMFYLGKKLAPKAQEWVKNYQALMAIVQELSDINIRFLKKERERSSARKQNKAGR